MPPRDSRSTLSLRLNTLRLVLLSVLLAAPAGATTFTWNNSAGGNWSQASNWSPSGVPSASGDIAVLGALSGAYQVTLDVDPAASEVHLESGSSLDLGNHSLGSVGQVYNAGTILNFRGGYDGTRLHNQTTGTIQVASSDSIVVSGAITNDGTIVVGPNLQNALFLTSTATFGGSGALVLQGQARVNTPLPRPETTIWLINGPGHTLHGAGEFWAPLKNQGLVLQDGSQGGLLILHQYLYNYGTIRVSNGATLNVDCPLVKSFGGKIIGTNGTFTVMLPYGTGGSIDNLNGGSFVADGGDLLIGAGVIANGSIERTGGSGAVSIISVATPSFLVVQPNAELRVDGLMDVGVNGSTLENHGIVRVRGTLNIDGTASNGVALTGDGTLLMDGGTLGTPAGAVLTNSAGHTIRGCGTITANINNFGVIDIDCPGGSMAMRGTITNNGRLEVLHGFLTLGGSSVWNRSTISAGGGTIQVAGGTTIDNQYGGTLTAGSGDIELGGRVPTTIYRGTLSSTGSGKFVNLGRANLQGVTIGPSATFMTINGCVTQAFSANLVNQGINEIGAGASFIVDASVDYLQTGGATVLYGGTLTVPRGLQLNGALRGTGTVVGNVTNQGQVSPDISSTGIKIQGDYHQLSSGRLDLGLSGSASNQFAHLNVTGGATLDGMVAVSTASGFLPAAGQDFQVMAFASRAGQFADVQYDPGLQMTTLYGSANLTLHSVPTLGVIDPGLPASIRFSSRGMGFALELPEAADVSVRAYDVAGREVALLASGPRSAGVHSLDLRATSLPSGLYFARATLRMSARKEVRTARVAFLR